MRIHSFARAVAYPESVGGFIDLINVLDANGIPFFIAGRMSNILIKDGFYRGVLIITTNIKGKHRAETQVTASCGESLSAVIRTMALCDLGGCEGLFGIPASVGGAVRQNAGAFGYEISDRFLKALCYQRSAGKLLEIAKKEMRFAYRDSILKDKDFVLLNATFDFLPRCREDVFDGIKTYVKQRREMQPTDRYSLGSVFKRYDGVGAGYYIDRAGLKGYSVGGAEVSEKHAGFIVNTGEATANDFLKLMDTVKEKVYSVFGVELKEEIEIIK